MTDVIIFAGTTEGRLLSGFLANNGVKVVMCVATGYSLQLTESQANLEIIAKRLDQEAMIELIKVKNCKLIVDATHPYAKEVTQNIKSVAKITKSEYIRVIRQPNSLGKNYALNSYIEFDCVTQVVEFLKVNPMKTLLTIGSKELAHFTVIEDFQHNIFARVLPFTQVVESCTELGFKGRQLICMQGPFSHELNVAMIKSLGVDCLVTKDSGDVGGFAQKLSAVQEAGIMLIVIGRSETEQGYSYGQTKDLLFKRFEISEKEKMRKMFPMFLSLQDKKVLFVGGGKIAQRRIETLLSYGAEITVVSPNITPVLTELVECAKLKYICAEYDQKQLAGFDIVCATTNNRETNQIICKDAKHAGAMVNVADDKEQSDFYFPAIIEGESFVGGIISKDNDHKKLKKFAQKIREVSFDETDG